MRNPAAAALMAVGDLVVGLTLGMASEGVCGGAHRFDGVVEGMAPQGGNMLCRVRRVSLQERVMNGQNRKDIRPGQRVEIVLKKDQRTGRRTVGVVKDILTSSAYHSRGIKVRLDDGQIGRVQQVLSDQQS